MAEPPAKRLGRGLLEGNAVDVFDRHISDEVTLRLPICPGVNALYRAFVRPGAKYATSIKSEAYRRWIKDAGAQLEGQSPACVPGLFEFEMSVPAKARGDLDGFLKASLDLLEAHGVIENDKHCQRIEVWRSLEEQEAMVLSVRKRNVE